MSILYAISIVYIAAEYDGPGFCTPIGVGGKCHHLDARIHHHGFIISILYNKFQNIPENVVKHERQLAYK